MNTPQLHLLALASWLGCVGAASAQLPVVASLSQNGVLACSNLTAGSVASVEWAPSLQGPWQTNWAGLGAVTVAADGTITVGVPMFYRVRGLAQSTAPTTPTATTSSATSLTGTSALLNGSGAPGNLPATGWFHYATTSPGTPNDTAGTRVPASGGTALGSGPYAVAYSQSISGLTPGTTYYCWAVVQNSAGTAFGNVVSFVTPLPPTATTSAASSVTSSSAYLNGSGTPNGSVTTGYFRYSLSNPGTPNDTAGARAPASGGTSLGAGWSVVTFSQSISGLSAGTTYYYWAVTASAEGTTFGTVMSFTTAAAPATTTSAASSVTSSSAYLNGSANPNRDYAYGYFRYSTTNPGTGNDTFGTRVPTTSSADSYLGSGSTAVAYSLALGGLSPATTYYYCAIGRNSYGTTFGAVLSFTTPAAAPVVSTGSASSLTGSAATLNGSVNPGGAATTGWFRYSLTSPGTPNDTAGTRVPASGGTALGSGTTAVPYSQTISGLTPGTTYYCWSIAQNAVGTAFGSVVSFVTPLPPTATTSAASSITSSSAYLNGSGTPNGSATTGYFRYSLTNPGTPNDTAGARAPASGGTSLGAGYSVVSFSQSISGLSAGTTYYYWAVTASAEGTTFGTVMSFTTSAAPTTTTTAATAVTSTTATLNGSANPNRDYAYGYFRYSTTNPGTGNDTFGTRVPATSSADSYLGSGSTAVAYSQALSGLSPATTYYYCAIGRNSYGTTFGAVLSFTTPAAAPVVSTGSASSLTGSAATLNGSVNPGGAATTGWFRYSLTSPGTANDTAGTRVPASGGTALGSGTTAVPYSQTISGLTPGTTYYCWSIAQNAVGTAFGSVVNFTTPLPPTATTSAASSITSSSAYLNGSGTPNGSATTGYFRYSLTNPGTPNDTAGARAPASGGTSLGAGYSAVSFSQSISGLSAGATYYYWAVTASAEGTAFGTVLSFKTN